MMPYSSSGSTQTECYNGPVTQDRYSRQRLFAPIGPSGQDRISRSHIAVVGCGALGTVGAEMLARAGVGRLSLIDRDFVEESNLQRQSLFKESDAEEQIPKAVAAQRELKLVNKKVTVKATVADLTFENIRELLGLPDLILDATDNFETRFLINDFAVEQQRTWVYGGCVSSHGTAFVFRPGQTPCLQCLFSEPPQRGVVETCDTAGVIAPIVHLVSAFQVAQCLRLLSGSEPCAEILQADIWSGQWRLSPAPAPVPSCRCCQQREFRFLSGEGHDKLTKLCGRNSVQVRPATIQTVDFATLRRRLAETGRVTENQYLMRIDVEGYEISLFPDGRSIVRGTDSPERARAVYAKYIGN